MMHYTMGIEETGQHHFHIAANLCFFWALVIPDAFTVKIEICFSDRNHKPRFHTSYDRLCKF